MFLKVKHALILHMVQSEITQHTRTKRCLFGFQSIKASVGEESQGKRGSEPGAAMGGYQRRQQAQATALDAYLGGSRSMYRTIT